MCGSENLSGAEHVAAFQSEPGGVGGIGCPDAVCVASGAGGESRGGMPSDSSLFNPPDTLTVP